MDLDGYRRLFPITEQYAYLDHAAAGPPPSVVIDAVGTFLENRARSGSLFMDEAKAMCERTRGKVAEFVGAGADEIAFTKNTPDGLSIVANGLKWAAGDNIVTADNEFPANVYPWLNLRDAGVEVRFVETNNGCLAADDVVGAIDDRTRLVALSWVSFHGGYRNDLAQIGSECRERSVYLAVDAIQGVGALRLDLRRLNVDFAAFSAQKWLLAPHAVGVFYCRREILDHLRVAVAGQTSMQLGPRYLDYDLKFKGDAGRFEPGFINQVGIAGFEAALDLLNEVGTDVIEARVLALTNRLRSGLSGLGCHVLGTDTDSERSGVVSFRHEGASVNQIYAALRTHDVVVSSREDHIRASPHFYNTDAEIDRLLEVVQFVAPRSTGQR